MNKSGQSTIEYTLLFAIVVVVVLLALSPGGFLKQAINHSMDVSVGGIESMVNGIYVNGYN